ncbi:MAG: HAD family hydrolase [Bacteroidaceae bacterium]|nr:HAD family hydrolase [Bacteroidaceae bacterium]MBR3655883.1 HAD family hydrolase [Prevotella sp.]
MKTFQELKKITKHMPADLPAIKVALTGDTATQFLATTIRGTGAERGYQIDLFEAEYNQVERQFLDPSSELYQTDADFIVLFQSTHKLGEKHSLLSPSQQESLAEERLAFVASVCENPMLASKKIICLNYPEIEDTVFGSYATKVTSSFTYQVRKLNMGLMDLSQRYANLFICDIAGLQNKLGRDMMFAPNVYVSTEMVLSIDALPYVASRVMDIICAIKGQFKKCLILDLDNTVWGGVIGDDGLEGIQLGHGLGIGKAFTEFQMWVKKLKQRGVIICVASKNNEDTAKEPFEKHPDMVLKLEDIAVFQANWETKVDNIRTIQRILNIGFDSMVFLDDNPFERNIVRENIPDITVPELPQDPGEYLEYLYSLNLFETASYSQADKDRTKQYQVEAQRVSLQKTFSNEADFLKSLDMTSVVSGFNKFNTPRVAQLSQRSNQFNLRTVRYTEADIEALGQDPDVIDLSFTLEDKFGDNGLIAVIIMKKQDEETLFIDTWFMSCRVLKRGMEDFTLNTMVEAAREKGYKRIIGEYLPTPKNKMVENHYPSLGFQKLEGTPTAQYVLDVGQYQPRENYIKTKIKQ